MENPLSSKAWTLPEMEEALRKLHAFEAKFDQCRLGLSDGQGNLHKKPTCIITSSEMIARILDGLRCGQDHEHRPVMGGSKITSAAGIYPRGLAKAFIDGIEKQFVHELKTPQEVLMANQDDPHGSQLHLDSESEEELVEDKHSKIPAGVKLAVKKLHEATGHRDNRRLARALVLAGAPTEVVAAAKQHKCALCDEQKPPKSRRPASLPMPRDTSDQIHLDIVEIMDCQDVKHTSSMSLTGPRVSRWPSCWLIGPVLRSSSACRSLGCPSLDPQGYWWRIRRVSSSAMSLRRSVVNTAFSCGMQVFKRRGRMVFVNVAEEF